MRLFAGRVTSPLMTPEQVCEALSIHRNTLLKWSQTGRIPGVRLGHLWRYQRDEIENIKKNGTPL